MSENVRSLILPKITYSKYCAKCTYCINASWNETDGVKFGIIDIICCAQGGICIGKQTNIICPNGICWSVCLGELSPDWNPEDWTPDRWNWENFKHLFRTDEELRGGPREEL